MIQVTHRPLQHRTRDFIAHIRDGYRSIKGKPAKYTLNATSPSQERFIRPNYKFDVNSVTAEEWTLLEQLVIEAGAFDGPIVEVGVLAGGTTQRIAAAKSNKQKIYAVDNFCWNGWGFTPEEHWSLVQLSLSYLVRTGHVEIMKMDKNEFFKQYDGPSPSLVFVDAMHDYEETKKDLLWAKSVNAKIICGHDYCDDFPGVMKIVDELGGPKRLAGSLFMID